MKNLRLDLAENVYIPPAAGSEDFAFPNKVMNEVVRSVGHSVGTVVGGSINGFLQQSMREQFPTIEFLKPTGRI